MRTDKKNLRRISIVVTAQTNGNNFFERECLLSEQPVFECLKAADEDNRENNC